MNQQGSAQSGVVVGSLLVIIGSVLLMERLHVIPTNLLGHFWPLFWIVVGIAVLVNGRGPVGMAWGVVMIAYGAATEAARAGWIRFRFWDLWPIWIIALGCFLLWRALRPPDLEGAQSELMGPRVAEFAVFGGGDRIVATEDFRGGNFTAVFGGHEVDLRHAKIQNGPAVLFADAIFGGVSLKVPPTWRVTVNTTAIFGGVDSKALPPAEGSEQTLLVKATAIFGGVEIKN